MRERGSEREREGVREGVRGRVREGVREGVRGVMKGGTEHNSRSTCLIQYQTRSVPNTFMFIYNYRGQYI